MNSVFEDITSEENHKLIEKYSIEYDQITKQIEEARNKGDEELAKKLVLDRWDLHYKWSDIDPRIGL